MDRLLYIAMTGAKENTLAQAKAANNLANVSTTGFKADLTQARAMPVFGDGLPSRVFSMAESPGINWDHGAIITTGNDTDVAVNGDGFLAVQDDKGGEGYSRFGQLRVNAEGIVETASGRIVLGNGGPISLPPYEKLDIASDGTISIRPKGAPPNSTVVVDRLKLVKPNLVDLRKSEDGLFRLKDGTAAPVDGNVRLVTGALEASNVNAVEQMIDVIQLARQFEVQVKLMRNAEDNDASLEHLVQV